MWGPEPPEPPGRDERPSPIDEPLYAELMAERAAEWRRRAAEATGEARVAYALRRAGALSRRYARKLELCAQRGMRTKCGCRGWRGVRLFTCRQHLLCRRCQERRARVIRARMQAALEAALQREPGRRIVLLTLTIEHSGDLGRDRRDLAAGWRAFYRALHARGMAGFAYVGVWEVTPGRDGLGHIHAHVAAVWATTGRDRYDWGELAALWRVACPRSSRINFVARRRDGRASDPRSVARYLGKYLSKGMEGVDFSTEMRSRVLAATYNTRWVFASRGLWQVFEPRCQACGQRVVGAQHRWVGVCSPLPEPDERTRGDPQLVLPLAATEQRGRGGGAG